MYDVFSLPPIHFPDHFVWGSATAGHQIEGDNIHSQAWYKEQLPEFYQEDPNRAVRAPSGKACDHYRLYRQDVELIAALGHRAYRMSIEWSRIEPEEGRWDHEALAHYRDLLERLVDRDIQVFVTLHHFTHPLWFDRLGGFAKADNRRFFERYLAFLLPRISAYVSGWNVINEFNQWGGLTAGPEVAALKFNMLRVHALGYRLIKTHSTAPVSSAHAFIHWFPRRFHDDLDRRMTGLADFVTNEFFFHALRTGELVHPGVDAEYAPEVKGALDCWCVNYYTRHMVDARQAGLDGRRFRHKELKMIPMRFYLEEMYPEGLIANLERLRDYPVYITENGCACDDDRFRIVYLALHLSALHEAMERGVDARGYFYWSLMDNYEWTSFVPRFGLVAVDFQTFERTPKPSALFYRQVIRDNGFDGETIRAFLDALPTLERHGR
ncbi:glycoside hydrolase family 1 [Desulfobulbus propionicus DSM 2032]|jgi:beta-glucosidase|uniref:Glycoside hydrolase family 1 n=1 Tax=Desulfobulbus propionicus (strain ATCC 33891 / DSM 2032 / VKM B-1956 / 1pr3) TaxID=577650 RepID=A0A7U3YP46_DESPD|nr:family 1 glycosylhydrolase [Desulfobulbus propionicus]ADW18818.1 glycoside hydrolase family 1 [Desulfobulbus propionicus DSM 2032]